MFTILKRAAKRTIPLLATVGLVLACTVLAHAQASQANTAINDARASIVSYFPGAKLLIYAIAAIMGLIGGLKLYGKISGGDQDAGKAAFAWFGGALFLVAIPTFLSAVFL